jgi:chromosome segregation ATPase
MQWIRYIYEQDPDSQQDEEPPEDGQQDLQAEVANLQQQIQQLQSQHTANLQAQARQFEEQKARQLETQAAAAKKELEKAKQDTEKAEKDNVDLRAKNTQIMKDNLKTQGQLTAIQQQVRRYTQDPQREANLEAQLKKALADTVKLKEETGRQIAQLISEIEVLEIEFESLQDWNEKLLGAVPPEKAQALQAPPEGKRLPYLIEEVKRQRTQFQEENKELKKSQDTLFEEKRRLQKDIEQLRQQTKTQLDAAQAKQKRLEEQLEELRNQAAKPASNAKGPQVEPKQGLNQENPPQVDEQQTQADELRRLQEENASLRQENREFLTSAEKEQSWLESQWKHFQKVSEEARAEAEKHFKEKQQFLEVLQELREQIRELKKQIPNQPRATGKSSKTPVKSIEQLENEKKSFQEQILHLEYRQLTLEAENRRLMIVIDGLRQDPKKLRPRANPVPAAQPGKAPSEGTAPVD